MRELDVKAMRRRLERGEFDWWMVAYHELHLDGSEAAAIVASEVHNAALPHWWRIGVELEPTKPEDHLPPAMVGLADQDEQLPEQDNSDALIDAAARAYG